jgi:hypothetical protein
MKELVVNREVLFQNLVGEPNDITLRAWMDENKKGVGGYESISKDDLNQRFALSPYIRMYEHERVDIATLESRFREDAITYVEENVLRVKLGKRNFQLRDGDIYSAEYGSKSILAMCRDAVLAREEKGISEVRAKHEGLGISNLVKLLEVMSEGDVAVLVSPPDSSDETMAGYSMVYVYEKGKGDEIWFGAVRDEDRDISSWQDFAREHSLWQTDWSQYDHLKFVALPFVTEAGLGEVLKSLGVGYVADFPDWIRREINSSAKMIVKNISNGNIRMAQRILDSLKIAVIAGRNKTQTTDTGYRVAEMILDPRYFDLVRNDFHIGRGNEISGAGGICGIESIGGLEGGYMDSLKHLGPANNLISSIMGVDESTTVSTETATSSEDITITLDSGETYVLKIRDGWKCISEGCNQVSNYETKLRMGPCKICEDCDPNCHKAD